MDFKIICTHEFRMLLSTIENFELDLGMTYSDRDMKGSMVPSIKDKFVLFYKNEYKSIIYKFGVIGAISLYTGGNIEYNQIQVFDSTNKCYTFNIDINMIDNVEKYIAELLMNL